MLGDHNCLLSQSQSERHSTWPFRIKGVEQEVAVRGNLRAADGRDLLAMCLAGSGIMRLAENVAMPLTRISALQTLLQEF